MTDAAAPKNKKPTNPHGIDDTNRVVFLSAGIDDAGEWNLNCQGQTLPKDDAEPDSANVYMCGEETVYLILPDPAGYTLKVKSSDKYNSATPKDPPFTSGEPPGEPGATPEDAGDADSKSSTKNLWERGTFTGTLTYPKGSNDPFALSHGYSYFKVSNWNKNIPGQKRYSDIAISFKATSTTDASDVSYCDPVFKIIIQRPVSPM